MDGSGLLRTLRRTGVKLGRASPALQAKPEARVSHAIRVASFAGSALWLASRLKPQISARRTAVPIVQPLR